MKDDDAPTSQASSGDARDKDTGNGTADVHDDADTAVTTAHDSGSHSADQQAADPQSTDEQTTDAVAHQPDADADVNTPEKTSRKGLLLGIGGGVLVGAIIALLVTGLLYPAFLIAPGKPDGTVQTATAALASKNPQELEKVSCKAPDGTPTRQIPAEALQLIQSATETGPPQLALDTEASAPVDLQISAQGQTQTLPATLVLGVTDGDWCMKGLSDRSQ